MARLIQKVRHTQAHHAHFTVRIVGVAAESVLVSGLNFYVLLVHNAVMTGVIVHCAMKRPTHLVRCSYQLSQQALIVGL